MIAYSDHDKDLLLANTARTYSRLTFYKNGQQLIVCTEDDYLQEWDYEDYRYVPDQGFVGQFVERILDGKLINLPLDIDISDAEFKMEVGIKDPELETVNYYDYGNFLITKVSDTDTNGTVSFEACDYTKKFNKVYEDRIEYPCLAMHLLQDACDQAGVDYDSNGTAIYYVPMEDQTLSTGAYSFKNGSNYINFTTTNVLKRLDSLVWNSNNANVVTQYTVQEDGTVTSTNVNATTGASATGTILDTKSCGYDDSFAGWNFVVENNQFEENKTLRDVVKAIAQLGATWARVGIDNKLHLDFTMGDTPDTYATMGTDNYYSATKTGEKYGPVTDIVIGMSNVEGENISYIAPATDGTTVEDTDIYVDDVNSSKRSQWALEGNSYQATQAASVNLLRIPNYNSYTHQGITSSYNNGQVTISGSATSNTAYLCDYVDVSLPAAQYTFSVTPSGNNFTIRLNVKYEDDSTATQSIPSTGIKKTFTTTKAIKQYRLSIGSITSGTSYSATFKLQLEQNSTYTSWVEPRDASPSPSNPSEVQVVTGDNEVVVCGKNIINLNNLDTINSGASTISQTSNGVVLSGTSSWGNISYYMLNPKPNTEYTISFKVLSTISRKSGVSIYKNDNIDNATTTNISSNLVDINANEETTITNTFNTSDKKYIVIRLWNNATNTSLGTTANLTFTDIQLEKGSTATTYEPYTSQNYPLYLGVENLAVNGNTSKTQSGVTFTINADKSISVNGTATADVYYVLRNDLSFKSGETYTLSGCNGGSLSTYYLYCYNIGEEYNGSKTATLSADFVNRQLGIVIKSGYTANNLTFYPQLERGSKANSYTPYNVTPIELCKIGNYQDKIFKTSGKNLLDASTIQQATRGGITCTYDNTTQVITFNGTCTSDNTTFTFNNSNEINFESGVTTSSVYWVSGSVTTYGTLRAYNSDFTLNNNIDLLSLSSTTPIKTRTANQTFICPASQVSFRFNNGSVATNFKIRVMIANSVDTTYEPYGSGKWYLSKEVRKLQLNISDLNNNEDYPGWLNQTQMKNDYPNINDSFGKYADYLCNTGKKTGIYQSQNPVLINTGGTGLIILNKSYFNLTQTQWKTNYHNLVFTLYYGLQTPEITEITDTELLEQLDALYNAKLFDGVNNILTTTANLPPILEFLYNASNTELAIYDNPLTYTEELRSIAIHYAKRLVGLEYTPAEVDTIGYPWLDGDDYCEINDLDGDTYHTYPFNRVITYKGYLDSSIRSIADGKIQTEYKYEGDVDRRIKHTEIIVDKHEGEIRLINENVDNVENNLSELEGQYSDVLSQIDTANTSITQLSSRVDTVQTSTYTKTQIKQIVDGTGVDGVKVTAVSTTEAKFDKDGMHYSKTDAPTTSTINQLGLEVDAVDGNEILLYAGYDSDDTSTTYGQSIVKTANLTVSNWTVVGTHGRFEKFSDGTNPEGVGFFLV